MDRFVIPMKKILIISATSGNNLTLANKIGKLFEIETEIISIEDYELPLYTGKLKLEDKTAINGLCQKVIDASGFVFCGPEYNGGSAPILTNAITWISVTTDHWRDAFTNKMVEILVAEISKLSAKFLFFARTINPTPTGIAVTKNIVKPNDKRFNGGASVPIKCFIERIVTIGKVSMVNKLITAV